MPRYLIQLAIGPVQDFIAAARRSRDLWFGSYLLSEVSKAAALYLYDQAGVGLIFPAPNKRDELLPDSPLNVANKILAEAETGDPAALLRAAKDAANHRWGDLAEKVLSELRKTTRKQYRVEFHVRPELWEDQKNDLLELFSAWTPLTDDYKAARNRVEKLLAARKNTRDFGPARYPELAYGVPKSSLDGKRESVLPDEDKLPKWVKRKLGLNPGEQLDCPGVVKRLGGDVIEPEGDEKAARFTSISRIALDPWIRRIERDDPGALAALHEPLEALVADGLTTRVKGNAGIYAALPFDGQLLYPFRLDACVESLAREKSERAAAEFQDREGAKERLKNLKRIASPLWSSKKYGSPNPC